MWRRSRGEPSPPMTNADIAKAWDDAYELAYSDCYHDCCEKRTKLCEKVKSLACDVKRARKEAGELRKKYRAMLKSRTSSGPATLKACEAAEALDRFRFKVDSRPEMLDALLRLAGWDGEENVDEFVVRIRREAILKARGE